MSEDGKNYSFFGHNLPARSVNPQQVRQMNRPGRIVVRQGSSEKALQKLETLSILSPAYHSSNSVEPGNSHSSASDLVHVPHPPTTQRSSSNSPNESPRAGKLKRTRLESPRTSGSEDERRHSKHLFNSRVKPLSALPPLDTAQTQRRGSTGSIGSVDSVVSAVSSHCSGIDSPRRHRNLRGIEPLKDIKSDKDLVGSFKAYQHNSRREQPNAFVRPGHNIDSLTNHVNFAPPESDKKLVKSKDTLLADESAVNSEQEEEIWHSTPNKSAKPEPPLVQSLAVQKEGSERQFESDSDESLTTVSSSSDEDSDSTSDLETKQKSNIIVKSLSKKRHPNSTLPTLPLHDSTIESGKYETINYFQAKSDLEIGKVASTSVKSNLSGTYVTIKPHQDVRTNHHTEEPHRSSASDLMSLEKMRTDGHRVKDHYCSDTDLSVKSVSSSQVSGVSQASLLPKVRAHSVRSRNRNFLREEMEKYLPDHLLGVFVATWNMHEEKEVPYCLDDLLLPPDIDYLQDIYVVGVQESTSSRKELEVKLQEALGPSHVLMHSCSFGVLHLAIFIRRELVWFCSSTTQDSVSTRIGHQFKTKGALGVAFSLFGTSFLFINSHFTSDEGKALDRVNDYQTICKSLSLSSAGQSEDVTTQFDRVFWLGDFNFRVELDREQVIEKIEKCKEQEEPDYKELLAMDQMTKLMGEEKVFVGFQEAPVKFLPSYKHDLQSDNYDSSSKMRTPSWTDRVVYRTQDQGCIHPVCYNSCATVRTSDHRPVFGTFEVTLNPCEENVPLTGGQYVRDVYIEASRRRAAGPRHQDQSSVCTIL